MPRILGSLLRERRGKGRENPPYSPFFKGGNRLFIPINGWGKGGASLRSKPRMLRGGRAGTDYNRGVVGWEKIFQYASDQASSIPSQNSRWLADIVSSASLSISSSTGTG